MIAPRPIFASALLAGLLAAGGCAPERAAGGSDSPRVERGPQVSSSRAELSLPLAALPGISSALPATTVPRDSLQPFPAATVNFVGQGATLEGCTFPNPAATCTSVGAPPYPSGAVGPNHYVQVVNGGIAIWDKTGKSVMAPKRIDTLWATYTGSTGDRCATENDGQSTVLFDRYTHRWLITQLSLPNKPQNQAPSYVCLAMSKTDDPTGAYYLYGYSFNAVLDDYPQFGSWIGGIYASFNLYSATGLAGTDVCAFDSNNLASGRAATQQCFLIPAPVSGVLPATSDGAVLPPSVPAALPPNNAPGVFLNVDTAAGQLNLWTFHSDFTTPGNSTLTGPTAIPVDTFSPACGASGTTGTPAACVPQPSPGNALAPVSDRLMPPVVYRNYGSHESLFANHSVTAGTAGGVRWYEVRSPFGTPTVFQQGTYAPTDGNWRFMGSLGADGGGNIALGFTLSSATTNPSVAWTGRLASDPAGTMGQGETVLAAGGGVETGTISTGVTANRWGAWSSMSLDIADDCTFWFTSELYPASGALNWDTRIASFKFPGCGASDFSLGYKPGPQSVPQGSFVDYTITTTVTKGNAEEIGFGIQGLRAGLTGAFNPPTVIAGGSTNVRITASPTATVDNPSAQDWFFQVVGSSPSATHISDYIGIQVDDCKPTMTTCPAPDNCGLVSNDCQASISCGGDCPAPQTCGGDGTPNVCGGMAGASGGAGTGGGGAGGAGRSGGGGTSGGAGGSAGGSGSGGGLAGTSGSGIGGGGATAAGAAGASGHGGGTAGTTGSGGGAGGSTSSSGGCGCSASGAPDAPLLGLALVFLALVARTRRAR
jgi:hypothetical protein